MKKRILGLTACTLLVMASCQNTKTNENQADTLSKEAIAIHDEIMPQISIFDKHTIVIDSLLGNLASLKATNNSLDTNTTRHDLSALKTDLESATDKMMTWMKEYDPSSTDTSYQKAELERISKLKIEFETVTKNADTVLPAFVK